MGASPPDDDDKDKDKDKDGDTGDSGEDSDKGKDSDDGNLAFFSWNSNSNNGLRTTTNLVCLLAFLVAAFNALLRAVTIRPTFINRLFGHPSMAVATFTLLVGFISFGSGFNSDADNAGGISLFGEFDKDTDSDDSSDDGDNSSSGDSDKDKDCEGGGG